MNCKHCGQEMVAGEEGQRPSRCPNVELFCDIWGNDTLTGKTYDSLHSPVHCTDTHVYHAYQYEENQFFHAV